MPELAKSAVGHAEFGFQFEIGRFSAPPDEKGVARGGILLGGFAGDGAVLDAPQLGIAVPAFERLAVEDRLEAVVIGRQGRRRAKQRECTLRPQEARHTEGFAVRRMIYFSSASFEEMGIQDQSAEAD